MSRLYFLLITIVVTITSGCLNSGDLTNKEVYQNINYSPPEDLEMSSTTSNSVTFSNPQKPNKEYVTLTVRNTTINISDDNLEVINTSSPLGNITTASKIYNGSVYAFSYFGENYHSFIQSINQSKLN
jgi:hypothetical protein